MIYAVVGSEGRLTGIVSGGTESGKKVMVSHPECILRLVDAKHVPGNHPSLNRQAAKYSARHNSGLR